MSDGMGREFTYLSSHATYRYFIPNWGIDFPDMGLLPAILVSVIAKRFHLVIDVVEFSMKAVVPRYRSWVSMTSIQLRFSWITSAMW